MMQIPIKNRKINAERCSNVICLLWNGYCGSRVRNTCFKVSKISLEQWSFHVIFPNLNGFLSTVNVHVILMLVFLRY